MSGANFEIDVIDRLTETCERLSKLEQKVEDYIDLKVKESEDKRNGKDNTYKMIACITSVLAGVSIIWQIIKALY